MKFKKIKEDMNTVENALTMILNELDKRSSKGISTLMRIRVLNFTVNLKRIAEEVETKVRNQ